MIPQSAHIVSRDTTYSGSNGECTNSRVRHFRVGFRVVMLAACVLSATLAIAQVSGGLRIGTIAFFGYDGLDPEVARRAMSIKAGDVIPAEKLGSKIARDRTTIQRAVGHPPTDMATVCCDASGGWLIYVGLPGKSSQSYAHNPVPRGKDRLDPEILKLVNRIEEEGMKGVMSGHTKEDDSNGYALAEYMPAQELQKRLRQVAPKHEKEVLAALGTSSDPKSRQAAAMAAGYLNQSVKQISSLVAASRDSDEGVRNNAIRAILVLASANEETARRIPAGQFIPMLNSSTWTDRNKGSGLMMMLTNSRDSTLLKQLQSEALPSLIEMAGWDAGHARAAQFILGRIAGIDDNRTQELVANDRISEVISAARSAAH